MYMQKFTTEMKKLMNPTYLPATLVVLLILLVLSYFFFSAKEGFECKPNELDSLLKSSDKVLVLFYADWCGHCTKLKPAWEEAATKANSEKKRMIQIDVGGKTAEQKELMDKYQIDGFPTILVFQQGVPTPYQGSRSVDAFLSSLGS
jgi:thiol:disulfide interchange protein